MIVTFACKESIVSLKSTQNREEEEKKEGESASAAAMQAHSDLMSCDIDDMMMVYMQS